MNLLSIDWDYFFADRTGYDDDMFLYDWGHRESKLFIEMLWEIRAAGFMRNKLPLPGTTGDELRFWPKIRCVPDAPLYIGESHMFAVDTAIYEPMLLDQRQPMIWSFDAHHDLGYSADAVADIMKGNVDCGSWLLWYGMHLLTDIHICYPTWHTKWADLDTMHIKPGSINLLPFHFDRQMVTPRLFRSLPVFDAIFVCRSGAWVPSWLDGQFFEFINAAPTTNVQRLGDDQYPLELRPFDLDAAAAHASLVTSEAVKPTT